MTSISSSSYLIFSQSDVVPEPEAEEDEDILFEMLLFSPERRRGGGY